MSGGLWVVSNKHENEDEEKKHYNDEIKVEKLLRPNISDIWLLSAATPIKRITFVLNF